MTTFLKTKGKADKLSSLISLLCILMLPFLLFFSNEIKAGVITGIDLSFRNIIPTLFPFFILADLWTSVIQTNGKSLLGRIFERLFGVSSVALPAFILGSVCGFPLGISVGTNLYKADRITKSELETLCVFSNNPSAAFVISGIGIGLYGDIKLGILLYSAVIISAILIGIASKNRNCISTISAVISRQSFNLVESIKKAGISSLTVSVYIIFFSSIVSLTSSIMKNDIATLIFACFFEVANASKSAASLSKNNIFFALITTAFALGFSGFSVHMQSFSILPKKISRRKYLGMKLLQGMICAAFLALYLIFAK